MYGSMKSIHKWLSVGAFFISQITALAIATASAVELQIVLLVYGTVPCTAKELARCYIH